MFTGIVEEVGTVRSVKPFEGGARLCIACSRVLDGIRVGDSMAVDGVCQTVVAADADSFHVETIATTMSRTTFGALRPGVPVNLERSLALGERLGGHLVQGHVDAVGTVRAVVAKGDHVLVDVDLPAVVAEVTVLHGSIAMNGVSLTVNALPAPDVAQVALIPFTLDNTNLRDLEPGSGVNLEADMIGRFVVHWLKRQRGGGVAE